ncbi:hypothetical protein CSC44_2278 [Pseudomonas aeruginosa]|nr:hypothetical protein CSC44_2278 [Pseudomonas aeruginosa]
MLFPDTTSELKATETVPKEYQDTQPPKYRTIKNHILKVKNL